MFRVNAVVVRWDRNEEERHLVKIFPTLNKARKGAKKAKSVWQGGIDGPKVVLYTTEIVRFEIEETT